MPLHLAPPASAAGLQREAAAATAAAAAAAAARTSRVAPARGAATPTSLLLHPWALVATPLGRLARAVLPRGLVTALARVRALPPHCFIGRRPRLQNDCEDDCRTADMQLGEIQVVACAGP